MAKASPARATRRPVRTTNEIGDDSKFDDLVKSLGKDDFVKSSPAKAGQGAQKLRSEAHVSRVSRDNDEVEAQSRSERDRWTFYEVIKI